MSCAVPHRQIRSPSVAAVSHLVVASLALRSATAQMQVELAAVIGWSSSGLTCVTFVPGEVHHVRASLVELMRPAVATGATSMALVHTHVAVGGPSGADHAFTRRMRVACAVLGVAFEGHWVVDPIAIHECDGADLLGAA